MMVLNLFLKISSLWVVCVCVCVFVCVCVWKDSGGCLSLYTFSCNMDEETAVSGGLDLSISIQLDLSLVCLITIMSLISISTTIKHTSTTPPHHQHNTTTPPLYYHYNTTSPPLHHHYITTTPPLHHHFINTTATQPLHQHNTTPKKTLHHHITTGTHLLHHRHNTTITSPQHHIHYNTTIPPQPHPNNTTTSPHHKTMAVLNSSPSAGPRPAWSSLDEDSLPVELVHLRHSILGFGGPEHSHHSGHPPHTHTHTHTSLSLWQPDGGREGLWVEVCVSVRVRRRRRDTWERERRDVNLSDSSLVTQQQPLVLYRQSTSEQGVSLDLFPGTFPPRAWTLNMMKMYTVTWPL